MLRLALIFGGLGVYMLLRRHGPNLWIGVRLPWTFADRAIWDKSWRLSATFLLGMFWKRATGNGAFVGLLSGHVVKPRYAKRKVAEAMTPRAQVHMIHKKELGKDPIARADKFFNDHPGIHKLLVVDDADKLRGLFTMNDVERIAQERKAQFKPARDAQFRLICGAAVVTLSMGIRHGFGLWLQPITMEDPRMLRIRELEAQVAALQAAQEPR